MTEALYESGRAFAADGAFVEAFGLALPELAAATKIWRKMYTSEEQLAEDAIAFMKQNVAQHWG